MRRKTLLAGGLVFLAHASFADLRVIIIDESALPYDLGPSKYENSPSKYENSASKYENSESKYDNSESKYSNSASNYANGSSGDRRLISDENEFLGYYVLSDSGVINFFSSAGKRVFYKSSSSDTQSVFSSSGEWCGTMGNQGTDIVLGIVENCFYRLILDN